MHEPADPMLEGLLRATLADRAERIRPSVTAVAVQERLEARRQQRIAPRRRPWLLLGVAALLVVSVAAVLVAQRHDATEAAATTYQAIVERTLPDGSRAIVAVRPDGMERLLTTVPSWGDADSRHPATVISPEGWLAAATPQGWVFRDLLQEGSPFGPDGVSTAWGWRGAWLDGRRFATLGRDGGRIDVVDLERGTTSTLRFQVPGDIVGWTRDGAALVTDAGGGSRLAARTVTGQSVPVAGLDLGWRTGTWWRADGSELQTCIEDGEVCSGQLGAEVAVRRADGALRPWATDASLPDERLVGAGLGTDALWLVFLGREGGRHGTLARAVAPERLVPVASWPLAANERPGGIVAVAPDGSVVVVDGVPRRLVDARTGSQTELRGSFVDLVSAEVADTWPGPAFATPDPSERPASRMPVDEGLPTADALVAEQVVMPGERALWRGGEDATPGDGSPKVVEIGPLDLSDGVGMVVACDGPGDLLLVALEVDGSPASLGDSREVRSRCLSPSDRAGGSRADLPIHRPIRFRLTTSADTAWRAVIYDPAPEPTDDATAP